MEFAHRLVATPSVARWTAVALACAMCIPAAFGQSASARVTVMVRVLPTRQAVLMQAQLKGRGNDGSSVTLTPAEKANFAKDKSSLLKVLKPDPDGYVRLLVEL